MAKRSKKTKKGAAIKTGQSFVACPPRRGDETPERKAARLACESRAEAAGLTVTRMADTRPTLPMPEGYKYTASSVLESQNAALSSEEKRGYGCEEVGYTVRERRAFGCQRDEAGNFTGSLADGTKDSRCTRDKKFSGSRRVGSSLVRDTLCTASFSKPCDSDRFAGSKHCPVQHVFAFGVPSLRLCKAKGEAGDLIAIDGPQAAATLAREACEWWAEKKTWDGFRPDLARGFGRAQRKRRRKVAA
jgi:hypothetical protein